MQPSPRAETTRPSLPRVRFASTTKLLCRKRYALWAMRYSPGMYPFDYDGELDASVTDPRTHNRLRCRTPHDDRTRSSELGGMVRLASARRHASRVHGLRPGCCH